MLNAILIDSATKSINEIVLPNKDGELNIALGCETGLEGILIDRTNMLYIDGQGLLRRSVGKTSGFTFGRLTITGRALIVGVDPDTGENADCDLTKGFVDSHLRWVRWDSKTKRFVDREYQKDV